MATKAKPAAKAVKKATEVTSKKKTVSKTTVPSKPSAKKAVVSSKATVTKKKAAKVVKKPTKKVQAKVVKPTKIEKPVKADSKSNTKIVTKKTTKSEPKVEAFIKKSAAKKVEVPVKKVAAAKKVVAEPKKETPIKKAPAPEVKKVEAAPKAEPVKKVEKPQPVAPIVKKETVAKKAAKKNTVTVIKTTTLKSSTASKTASAIPIPSNRPAITRSAIRDEKKTNVVIAHRRLENKSKKDDESGKTMINYQPDYTRSILDQSVEKQGPVYRYSDEELNEFKELINSRLEAARKELSYLQALIMRKDETGTEDTENRYLNMEDGSGAMEREQLSQLASRQIQFTNHLEKALIRIESKTYGICRVTGKLIDKARLRAVPHATLSIEAKNTMTKK